MYCNFLITMYYNNGGIYNKLIADHIKAGTQQPIYENEIKR